MDIPKKFIRIYLVHISILIFLVLFTMIHLVKPHFLYNEEGGFRPFGVGYKHKTVIPIWLIAIILAMLSYLFVLQFVN